MADVGNTTKFKNEVKKWIKDTAELHKKLDRLNRQVQKDKEFSQVQRQLEFVSNASKTFFSQIKSLFVVVK